MKNEIKLLEKFEYSDNPRVPDFCIYEVLEENLKNKYQCNFFVSQGEFSDYAMENAEASDLIEGLCDMSYEGTFTTLKEAVLQTKCAITTIKLRHLENGIKELLKFNKLDQTKIDQAIDQCDELLK